jgi:hypothetical protein
MKNSTTTLAAIMIVILPNIMQLLRSKLLPTQSRGIFLVISASVEAAIRLDGSGSLFPAIISCIFYTGLLANNESWLLKAYREGTSPARPSILREEVRSATSARNASQARADAADGCQALRVSIERALGDDAAVRIASAPGMITGGAA